MATHTRVLLHANGPALWPEHKDENEVRALKARTPPDEFEATYQLNPTAAGGTVFRKEWWADGRARYDFNDRGLLTNVVSRFISFDTAHSKSETAAFTAWVVAELLKDFRLVIRHVGRKRMTFPELVTQVQRVIPRWRKDGKLRGIIIEDKDSGTALLQSLAATADSEIVDMLYAYNPRIDKVARANMASVHCQNGMVLLPYPDMSVSWLYDFEEELFAFPGTAFKDQVDSFSQQIIYLEHFLSEGFRAYGNPIGTNTKGG